ncbi:hypothetical protein ASPVEDRAFT_834435 [Aspergillus versicolor CBS 583.65]|uniref:F-box domain-containing protein n=1 Tax=Aspergillus versicolor CBS 583.65 TaxID=1036611 RepID=A0A1L9PUC9_ASPVE|nr:uncharacterized protein ASPVEDRAFT_834435 [Aspergillus versicolor CBS 583.65]OJJ05160.1 hypothetical protein ASPVEDRAFT_834435 [Aspergillus versicolor CBS 583.65]
MPDPSTLPLELFTEVTTLALQPPIDTANQAENTEREYDFHAGINIPHLAQLTLVNRQWHSLLLPTLYARYMHNGARHSYTSLWRFVRTAISNPQIAQLVRAVSIGNFGFYPGVAAHDELVRGDNVEFTQKEVELMSCALRSVFTSGDVLEAKVLDPGPLVERDSRPLVVLLLVCLSNLDTVYLHLPEHFSVLRSVFEEILRCQDEDGELPCLRNLTSLYLLGEAPVYGPGRDVSLDWPEPALRMHDIWPCLYFTGLRKLALYGLETQGIASLLAKSNGRTCRIKELRVVVLATTTRSSTDLLALVNLPQSLASFSLYWDHNIRNPITRQKEEEAPVILVTDIWDALQKYRESLEELAITYKVHQDDEPPPGHFGSLREFPRLKRLDTQLSILLDGMTPERFAPFRLKDTIPENLDTLVIHPGWVDEVDMYFPNTEFQAVVAERRRPLKRLVIDDYLAVPFYNKAKTIDAGRVYVGMEPNGPESYPGLWELCKKAGTQLDVEVGCVNICIEDFCEFHQGGACLWLWRKTWNICRDGFHRNKEGVERLREKEEDMLSISS